LVRDTVLFDYTNQIDILAIVLPADQLLKNASRFEKKDKSSRGRRGADKFEDFLNESLSSSGSTAPSPIASKRSSRYSSGTGSRFGGRSGVRFVWLDFWPDGNWRGM
jgi:hypothetical protein